MADPPTLTLATPDATATLGAEIAHVLRRGEAVCLRGPLGAGKSTLARGLVRALTSPGEEVPSPTFTLVQPYECRGFQVFHFDLYRLRRAEEADELGLEDALAIGCAVIEWPERLEGALPADRLDVTLVEDAAGGRVATLVGHGVWRGRERDLLRPPRR